MRTVHETRQHKLEGAGHKADPFEYPINTVQVFRCAPFLGSPFVGVALGLMTTNVRTPPVGTIEQTWQFPENFHSPGPPRARALIVIGIPATLTVREMTTRQSLPLTSQDNSSSPFAATTDDAA